jgi:phage-related protein
VANLNLKLSSIQQKNKLVASTPWITLVKITLDPVNNPSDIVYLADNNQDVVYQGNTYLAFSFDLAVLENKSGGELPQLELQVSNVNGAIQAEMNTYGGGVDATVQIMLVNTADLAGEPEFVSNFEIIAATADEAMAHFTLGAPNLLRSVFPKGIYLGSYCRHVFNTPTMQANLDPRGRMCGYVGNLTSCSKLLDGDNGCAVHGNVPNYGASPSIDVAGFRRATTS